jgi:RNA polymerase sigma factor (sigma-70 family)
VVSPSLGEAMSEAADTQTSVSLLGMFRHDPSSAEAWDEFVRRYRPKIYGWCCARGLQQADAEDVAQIVLAKLTEKMRDFRYDPTRSFRAWLKTVTQRTLLDFVASRQRGEGRGDDRGWEILSSLEARTDLEQQLEAMFDRELLDLAMLQVRQRVSPQSWAAFRLTALEGLSGADASRQLGMPVANVFMAKHRVQKTLQEEVRKLDGAGES